MSTQKPYIHEPETDFDVLMALYGAIGLAQKHNTTSNISHYLATARERADTLIKRMESREEEERIKNIQAENRARRLHP